MLLPGTLCDERVFAPLVSHLAGIRTLVVPYVNAMSMQEAAQHVLSQVPEQFALLGYSLGGMVAMEIAAAAPSRTRGLALLSTSPLPVPVHRHAARRDAAQKAGAMAMTTFVEAHLWPDYRAGDELSGTGKAGDPVLALMQAMASSAGHTTFCRQTEMALSRPDYRDMLGSVRCPAVVIAGDQDRLCPPEAQSALHEGLPGSTLHMLKGAGHLAVVERADEIACHVAAWFHTVCSSKG